ncbi:DNA-directed RNA polymerases I and III subunit RPAC2 [Panicum miliaceum]|uniref:DNA-directed RNA polymerases I and III subunit RPAC2 n=1 Tax=Panicum miliaceum TaxID=4540 RepID=A0A3L6PNW2_PANMI|nr:DNA-directed RNA polymerases I and III subunit RPAC2 [Panicum miliaceum]
MEHGSVTDSTASTFSIMEEDHTLANSARFVLNQDPIEATERAWRKQFREQWIEGRPKINIRVQTTGDPAKDVLKDALQDLMVMCQHVRGTFDNAMANHRAKKPAEQMDVDQK